MYTIHTVVSEHEKTIRVLGQVKKKHVSRPDFYKKESGWAGFFCYYYFLLHAFFTHYYLPPGALRSNIVKRNIRY